MSDTCSSKNSLQILNVIVTVPDTRHGGAERAGISFGKSLSNDLEVDTVMMGEIDEDLAADLRVSQDVYPQPAYTLLRDLMDNLISSNNNIWNAGIATRLNPPDPVSEYDIIHIHNAVPIIGMVCVALQSQLSGVPYCVTTHGLSKLPEIPKEQQFSTLQSIFFNQIFLSLYRWVLENAAHLFVLSKSDKQTIRNWFPDQSVSVLHNGVELYQEDSEEITPEYIDENIPLVLFVGRIMKSKGVADLLDAYQMIDSECQLVVVGPVRDEEYIERMSSMNCVQYTGYIDQDVLDAIYKRADVFVFPTRSDVFPLVTLEAMAAGTPVISTSVGGLPEQITDDVGRLVPPNDPKRLADALESFLSMERKRKAMGERGRELVKNQYSWEAITSEAVKEYRQILDRDSGTTRLDNMHTIWGILSRIKE